MDGSHFVSSSLSTRATILSIPSLSDTEAQLALTPKIEHEAFSIRYRGYLSYGYITARDSGIFSDKYDGRLNSKTIVIYRGGLPAATIRICLYDAAGRWPHADRVPAMEIFDDEIRELQAQLAREGGSSRVIEITRFARDPAFANDRSLIIAAFRIVAYLRLYFDAGIMLNAVRPHHMPMYRRLGFQQIEEPRQYPNLTYRAGLMAMFAANYEAALKKIGFPNGVSVDDPIYSSLMAGERVGVFDETENERASSVGQRTRMNPLPEAA